MAFQLPSNVTALRLPISDAKFAYVLWHSTLGKLGRITLEQDERGCSVAPELNAVPSSLLTERRREAFEPIVRLVVSHFDTTSIPDHVGL